MKIANRKSKGRNLEYSVWDSLKPFIDDIRLMSQLGYPQKYDLISDSKKMIIECKRHKGFSWNELFKYFCKLEEIAVRMNYTPILVFQANRQPALCMVNLDNKTVVMSFEHYFEVEFYKHKGVKK